MIYIWDGPWLVIRRGVMIEEEWLGLFLMEYIFFWIINFYYLFLCKQQSMKTFCHYPKTNIVWKAWTIATSIMKSPLSWSKRKKASTKPLILLLWRPKNTLSQIVSWILKLSRTISKQNVNNSSRKDTAGVEKIANKDIGRWWSLIRKR